MWKQTVNNTLSVEKLNKSISLKVVASPPFIHSPSVFQAVF
jgi:hypothetical protein